MRFARTLSTLCLLLLLVSAVPAEEAEEEPEVDIEALKASQAGIAAKFQTEMTELSEWADKEKLYHSRDRCYFELVLLEPDHKLARKTLRFYRDRDGQWVRRSYRLPKDHELDLIPEFNKQFDDIRKRFVDSLHENLDASEGAKIRDRVSLTDLVLKALPNDANAREIRGEAKQGSKWVLVETVTAEERREELSSKAGEIIDAMEEPTPITPDSTEKQLGVEWQGACQGTWWRGMGTVPPEEVLTAVRILDASHPFFDHTFGLKTKVPKNCGFYLMNGKDEATKVLSSHPQIPASKREFYLGLRAGWIPGRNVFFQWNDTATVRLDGATRNALGILILRNFHVTTKRGWVWEGLGLYLDYHLTGGHRTVFVTPGMKTTTKRKTPFDIETRMRKPGADWVQLAFELVDTNSEPPIQAMAQKKVNEMTPEDLVYGYALVSYLIEGHPEKATHFISLHGNYQPIDKTITQVFDWPLDYFMERFHRWLNEIN